MSRHITFFFVCLLCASAPAGAVAPPTTAPASSDTFLPGEPRRLLFSSRRGAVDTPAEDFEQLRCLAAALVKELESATRRLEATIGRTKTEGAVYEMGRNSAVGDIDPVGKGRAGGQKRAGENHQCSRTQSGEQRPNGRNALSGAQELRDGVPRAVGREGSGDVRGYESLSHAELKGRVGAVLAFLEYMAEKEKKDNLRFLLFTGAAVGGFAFLH